MQTKAVEGYALTLAPGGSKMNAPSTRRGDAKQFRGEGPVSSSRSRRNTGEAHAVRTHLHEVRRHLGSEFIRTLSGQSEPSRVHVRVSEGEFRGAPAPILDKTGLTGKYDFTFDYAGGPFFRPKAAAHPRLNPELSHQRTRPENSRGQSSRERFGDRPHGKDANRELMFRERKGRGGVLTWIKTAAAAFRFARF